MKKLISLLLILSTLTSCTAYFHSYRPPEGERIKPSDLSELDQGDKIRVVKNYGVKKTGILESFSADTLIIMTGRGRKIPYTVLLKDAKIIKYDEDVPTTVIKTVLAGFIFYSAFVLYVFSKYNELR